MSKAFETTRRADFVSQVKNQPGNKGFHFLVTTKLRDNLVAGLIKTDGVTIRSVHCINT